MRRLVVLFLAAGHLTQSFGIELGDYWKKDGWKCDVRSSEVLVNDSTRTASPKFLACVYTVDCASAKSAVWVTHACRTTLENACPSVDDCIAQKAEAVSNKDYSLFVGAGRNSKEDGTLKISTEQRALMESQHGTACRFTPEDLISVVYRKLDPKKQSDSLCVNRVTCDQPSKRGVVSQIACPTTGTEMVSGTKFHVCPGIQDCLASAVEVRKPTRELLTKELPTHSGNATVQVTTHLTSPSQAAFGK